jgi:DNA polymerase-3 subunit delta
MVAVKAGSVDAVVRSPDPRLICFLVYGPDSGLASERARALAESAADDALGLVRLEGDEIAPDPGRLLDEARAIPMFGGGRAIWVRLGSRSIAPAVAALLEEPAVAARVVIEAGELRRGDKLRALCEASPRAAALPCFADTGRAMTEFIDAELGAAGLGVAADARALLVELLGPDRLLNRQELQKLALYAAGGGEIGRADVEAAVADGSTAATDELVDAVFAGDLAAVEQALDRLGPGSTAATGPLAAALNHALRLYRLRTEVEAGASAAAVLDRGWSSLHFRRRTVVETALGRLSLARLETVMGRLFEAVAEGRKSSLLADLLARRGLIAAAVEARRVSSSANRA